MTNIDFMRLTGYWTKRGFAEDTNVIIDRHLRGKMERRQNTDEPTALEAAAVGNRLVFWGLSPLVLLLVYGALGWFDTTTELIPGHDRILNFCFVLAGVAGLLWGLFSVGASKGMSVWRRVIMVLLLALVASLPVFMVSMRSAEIIEGLVDFPASKTRTFPALLVIWRAYQTHGKGQSWCIQTTPVWSNLDVTQSDYEFMLAHRSPNDHGHNPDEVSSHGYFCARVAMQQSGNAFRVLHAGSEKLPEGTVMMCPTRP